MAKIPNFAFKKLLKLIRGEAVYSIIIIFNPCVFSLLRSDHHYHSD